MNGLPQPCEGHRNVIIEILNHALREDRLAEGFGKSAAAGRMLLS